MATTSQVFLALLITKMNTNPTKIGQAIMSTLVRKNGQVEVTFDWVQPKRGEDFDSLVGLSPTYNNILFPVSTIRLGNKDTGETQAIMFIQTGRKESLVTGEYAGLIKFNPEWNGPEILCIASKSEFDSVVEALKVQKESRVSTSPAPGLKKTKMDPSWNTGKAEEVEDPTIYKVEFDHGGRKVKAAGTLKEIVAELTTVLKKDPDKALHAESTKWWRKGDDSRYHLCLIPAVIPVPPVMLLVSAGKKGQVTA